MTSIFFGCEPLGGTDWGHVDVGNIKNAIHKALDLGINSFDTAGVYGLGLSEERLSKILGSRRHDMIIATKGGLSWKEKNSERSIVIKDSSPASIRRDVESSLRRLRLETLPIFFVHWPDDNTAIEDTFLELLLLKKEGKIQSIGCSDFSEKQLKQAITISKVDYIQIPVNILSGSPDQNISAICKKNDIKLIAYNVLANGLLTGKYNENSIFPNNDRRSRLPLFKGINFRHAIDKVEVLKVKAAENNISLAQYVINWTLMHENISSVILGIKNSKQIEDNFCAIS